LVPANADPVAALWAAPQAVVAHGTEADPIFFFGNRAALDLFETAPEEFSVMPSRLSAEAPLRAERATFLARVAEHGFVDDYSGVRISAGGRRFTIHGGIVWNLVDAAGQIHGQAATFAVPRP
jgi:MEKHLA domain